MMEYNLSAGWRIALEFRSVIEKEILDKILT